jgi:ABC-type glycerol-3-phosphate transport system permease component
MAARPAWMEKPSIISQLLKATVLIALVIVMLFPFVYVTAVSLSSSRDVLRGGLILFPQYPTLESYREILRGGIVQHSLMVSVGITLVGTAADMVMTVALAYGLSRTRDVPGSKFVLYLVLGSMLFGAGIIPNYLLVKSLHLLNTYASLIVPGLIAGFNLVVVRSFFMNIPQDLIDSARIDGAGNVQVLWRIILPLSKAVLAVVALFYGVAHWNAYFNALLYLNDASKWPVQLILMQYVLQGTPLAGVVQQTANQPPPPPQSIQMAVVVLATVPIILVYPFLQKYFTKGVLTGAIKG